MGSSRRRETEVRPPSPWERVSESMGRRGRTRRPPCPRCVGRGVPCSQEVGGQERGDQATRAATVGATTTTTTAPVPLLPLAHSPTLASISIVAGLSASSACVTASLHHPLLSLLARLPGARSPPRTRSRFRLCCSRSGHSVPPALHYEPAHKRSLRVKGCASARPPRPRHRTFAAVSLDSLQAFTGGSGSLWPGVPRRNPTPHSGAAHEPEHPPA